MEVTFETKLKNIPPLSTYVLLIIKILSIFVILLFHPPLFLLLTFLVLVIISISSEVMLLHAISQRKGRRLLPVYLILVIVDGLVFLAILFVFDLFQSDFYLLGLIGLSIMPFRGGLLLGLISGVFTSLTYFLITLGRLEGVSLLLRSMAIVSISITAGYWGELFQRESLQKEKAIEEKEYQQEVLRSKNEFFSLAAHNLRTPLTHMKGFTEVLREKYLADKDKVLYLGRLKDTLKNFERSIDEILSVSRVEMVHPEYEFESLDLIKLLKAAVSPLQKPAQVKKLHLILEDRTHDLPRMKLSRNMFQQAVSNLLENAIKFTDQGEVKLSCWNKENEVFIEVSDTGMGIVPEDLKHIFRPFFRGELAETKGFGGTGLGLYLVEKVINEHGGSIKVESGLGQGTIFTIRLFVRSPEEFLKSF